MLYVHTPDMYAANMAKNENIPTQIPSSRHLVITRSVKSQNFITFLNIITSVRIVRPVTKIFKPGKDKFVLIQSFVNCSRINWNVGE